MEQKIQKQFALHPTIFIIFGITGDLASRKLLPALLGLYAKGLLPQRFTIIGFSRRPFSREDFRDLIRSKINIKPGQFKEEDVKHFLDHISYEQGMFNEPAAYERLASKINSIDKRWGQCSNKLFHLSVPPTLYEGVLTNLSTSKMTLPCDDGVGWTRILIEKPFGNDIHTAKSLDTLLGKLFKEEQIFRIDHYLAKEALQNIVAFRFTNALFEPIWKAPFIDKVHIKLFEKIGMEGRGAFYDPVGALKDVGQNHILQMLALIAMDKPKTFSANSIRRERKNILEKLQLIKGAKIKQQVVKGQYEGYLRETGVSRETTTETYFRIKAAIASPRWKGVPFYIESGKAMAESKTEIDVYFHSNDKKDSSPDKQNIMTFRIQPDEGIKIKFFVKTPGYDFDIEPKTLKFKYSDSSSFTSMPNDYERLIHDAFIGDQTLFASTDEIMASWKFVTPILDGWEDLPLVKYPQGAREVL